MDRPVLGRQGQRSVSNHMHTLCLYSEQVLFRLTPAEDEAIEEEFLRQMKGGDPERDEAEELFEGKKSSRLFRLKKWWVRQSQSHLDAPDVPWVARWDWSTFKNDCEQNRHTAALERQESFDHRYKYSEFRVWEDVMKRAQLDARRRQFLERKFGFLRHPIHKWPDLPEECRPVGNYRYMM